MLQRQKQEEKEKRLKESEEDAEISPEERLRMQKESDLKLALETTFGGDKEATTTTIDGLSLPNTKEEFELFAENLSKKLSPLAKSSEYITFVENLTRNLCATSK